MAKANQDIRSLARSHTATCIKVLAGIVNQRGAPASARAFAANSLLDRGWGKAPVQLTGEDGGPIRVIIRQIVDIVEETDTHVIEHDDGEG